VRVKTLWFVLVVVAASIVTFAGVFALVAQPGPTDGALLWLGVTPLTVFVNGPMFLGLLLVYWDARRSAGARRYFSVALWIVSGLEALSVVAIVVYAVLAGAALWLPVVFIATGVSLTALVLVVAPRIGARSVARAPAPAAWTPVPRAEVMRKVRNAAITLVGTFVVAVVGLVFALPGETGGAVRLAAQFACFAASFVLIAYSVSLSRRLRDITGRDLGLTITVARVVLRGKPADLDDEGRAVAAKYAAVMPSVLGFQAAYLGLLWVGLAIQSAGFIESGMSPALSVPILAAFVLVVLIVIPLLVLRIRRASHYARAHADLLPAGG
jgi:hypothetical protein